jgi:hypothetical protein
MISTLARSVRLGAIVAAAALVIAPQGATALGVSFSVGPSSPQNGTDNEADLFASNYSAFLPTGASWTSAPNTVASGSSNSDHKSPWVDTSLEGTNSYWSVEITGNGSNPAELKFNSLQSAFTILWGSIDSYNKVRLGNSNTGSWSDVLDGAAVASEIGAGAGNDCGSPETFECVALVTFSAGDGSNTFGAFDIIEFESDGKNAFEFGTIPLPAAAWLLLGVSGALVAAKRRSARHAA